MSGKKRWRVEQFVENVQKLENVAECDWILQNRVNNAHLVQDIHTFLNSWKMKHMNEKIKGLIFCHSKKVSIENGQLQNHWYGKYILMDVNFEGVDFKTVDIYYHPEREEFRANFVADCFGVAFINEHKEEFTILIAPDCGGKWYKVQESLNYVEFCDILKGMIALLKEKCLLILDKMFRPEFFEAAKQFLEDHQFRVIKFTGGNSNAIAAIRQS